MAGRKSSTLLKRRYHLWNYELEDIIKRDDVVLFSKFFNGEIKKIDEEGLGDLVTLDLSSVADLSSFFESYRIIEFIKDTITGKNLKNFIIELVNFSCKNYKVLLFRQYYPYVVPYVFAEDVKNFFDWGSTLSKEEKIKISTFILSFNCYSNISLSLNKFLLEGTIDT